MSLELETSLPELLRLPSSDVDRVRGAFTDAVQDYQVQPVQEAIDKLNTLIKEANETVRDTTVLEALRDQLNDLNEPNDLDEVEAWAEDRVREAFDEAVRDYLLQPLHEAAGKLDDLIWDAAEAGHNTAELEALRGELADLIANEPGDPDDVEEWADRASDLAGCLEDILRGDEEKGDEQEGDDEDD
jgi:hypothetical protein